MPYDFLLPVLEVGLHGLALQPVSIFPVSDAQSLVPISERLLLRGSSLALVTDPSAVARQSRIDTNEASHGPDDLPCKI